MDSYFRDVQTFPVEITRFPWKSCDNQAKTAQLGLARSVLVRGKVGLLRGFHGLLRGFQIFHECPVFLPVAASCSQENTKAFEGRPRWVQLIIPFSLRVRKTVKN